MTDSRAKLLTLVDKIPAFSQSVNRILQLTSDMNCSPKELLSVVEHDPILTMKILRLVNSPVFGLAQQITSISHALVYIGLNTLKNITLSLAVIGALPRKNKAGFDINAFWLHCLAVGVSARQLGEHIGISRAQAGDLFVAGLLHDIGKVIFALYEPELYKSALAQAASGITPLHEAEQQFLNDTHANMGALLAEKWVLPVPLRDSIAHHHSLGERPSSVVACVFAANQAAKKLHYGFAGNVVIDEFPDAVQDRLGLDQEGALQVLQGVDELVEKAKLFI
ncbi:HDOD domain-containing protein [Desulfovibrio inopinatus]|uniref:HDOD domain-containing protein n=1 Tax=Desulfovibrio inopinatus TaxID=102109 RepID=UPI0005598E5A|nr:HDOD domain-containing protein [Desulfovibrio inopinatus]